MAFLQASINLIFNAGYAGCHRVCWRIQGDINYNCTTQVNCTGNGAACPVTIPITVNDNLCTPVTYEGYAQACCEDINSLTGRLPFAVIYNPTSPCPGQTITCIGPVSVSAVFITNPGTDYLPGAIIPLVFAGGGGAGAIANAIIGDGGVSDIGGSTSVLVPGAGYVNGTYSNVPAITLTGVGVGALFTVVVAGGAVISADVVPGSNGINYAPLDTISFAAANLGGSGAGVVVQIVTINTGQVQSVILVNGGAGYTSQATGTIPPSIGTPATFLVQMGLCPVIVIDTCGGPNAPIAGVPLGTSFVACHPVAYVLPPEYTVNPGVCCADCTSIAFNKGVGPNYDAIGYYEDCATKLIVQIPIAAGTVTAPVCAVNGSWFVVESNPSGTTTIDNFGSCP